LRMTLGPSPSIAATMCLVTAFFDPRTEMSPRSGPDGSTTHVCITGSQYVTSDALVPAFGDARAALAAPVMPQVTRRLAGLQSSSGEERGDRGGELRRRQRASVIAWDADEPSIRYERGQLVGIRALILIADRDKRRDCDLP
jgi:hypothetical protein